MTITRCRDCAAWDVRPEVRYDEDGPESAKCRRYAPRPVMYGLFVDGNGRTGETYGEAPSTDFDGGCCEGIPLPTTDTTP